MIRDILTFHVLVCGFGNLKRYAIHFSLRFYAAARFAFKLHMIQNQYCTIL